MGRRDWIRSVIVALVAGIVVPLLPEETWAGIASSTTTSAGGCSSWVPRNVAAIDVIARVDGGSFATGQSMFHATTAPPAGVHVIVPPWKVLARLSGVPRSSLFG